MVSSRNSSPLVRASSKASYEANSGLKMTPDEEKKLVEKLRKRYPGVARLAC